LKTDVNVPTASNIKTFSVKATEGKSGMDPGQDP